MPALLRKAWNWVEGLEPVESFIISGNSNLTIPNVVFTYYNEHDKEKQFFFIEMTLYTDKRA